MRIAICDDDYIECDTIKKLITSMPVCRNTVVDVFSDGDLLIKEHGVESYDIIYMDVDMPGRTGIEIGNQLCQSETHTILIFITSYPQYAIEAYDCNAFHYLIKPVNKDKFEQVLMKAVNKYNMLHASIKLETRKGINMLPVSDICYVECMQKNLIYYTTHGNYTVRDTLSNALDILLPHGFCQTHQGYIVNMNKIQRITTNQAILTNGMSVMISVRRQKEVERTFTNYLEKTL